MNAIMETIAEAVGQIEAIRVLRSSGSLIAIAEELNVLIHWRNWATDPSRRESDAESRFTSCLKGLCDNSLLDYAGQFYEDEEGELKRKE